MWLVDGLANPERGQRPEGYKLIVAQRERLEFHVQPPTADRREVVAWSSGRLPFEPEKAVGRPWLVEFRAELRSAVRQLEQRGAEMVLGEFATDESHRFDVENVLFYNVGLDVFVPAGRDGIGFARRVWPGSPAELSTAHCMHRYKLQPIEVGVTDASPGVLLATWAAVPFQGMAAHPSASVAWFAMRQADVLVHRPADAARPFAVRLTLDVPGQQTPSAVHLMKPLLDGVISAFHDYVGTDLDRMSLRLATQLGEDQLVVRSLLVGSGMGVLGSRRVLTGWGSAFQWNPADDRCDAGLLVIQRGATQGWRLSGEIAQL